MSNGNAPQEWLDAYSYLVLDDVPRPYWLPLTAEDIAAIGFVGHRYGWSDVLCPFEAGSHNLTEGEAWAIAEACESDTEGGHSYFPMLDPTSELAEKLTALLNEIV